MRQTRASMPLAPRDLRVHDLGAPVEVRRHPSARRMTLRVSRTRRAVIVTLPLQCDLAQAGSFLTTHIDWVRERLGSLPMPVLFRDGAVIPLRGEPHRLAFTGPGRAERVVAVEGSCKGQPRIAVTGAPQYAPRRLRDWLFAEARRDLAARVAWHASRLALEPRRIAVRDQSSRWGSCSTNGLLSFSWRLVLAPPAILDYVAAHEVAHLAEMNHGPRFWALVSRTCPAMDEARRWLQRCGSDLHRYEPID